MENHKIHVKAERKGFKGKGDGFFEKDLEDLQGNALYP